MKFCKISPLIFLIVFFCNTTAMAQHKDFDVGILLGTSQYNGDINLTRAYYSPQPTIAGIFKKNYNPHYSLRLCATLGNLKAEDEDFDNAYQQNRNYYFDNTKIMEFSCGVEFNFFELTEDPKTHNFSPYVTFGLGALYMENSKWFEAIDIPMGLGLKYKVHPRLELRGEWVFRKTFTDRLDQLADAPIDGYQQYKQISFQRTKDWFSVLGISLLMNFSDSKVPCHIYDLRVYHTKKKR